jgi:hypothetical protein
MLAVYFVRYVDVLFAAKMLLSDLMQCAEAAGVLDLGNLLLCRHQHHALASANPAACAAASA